MKETDENKIQETHVKEKFKVEKTNQITSEEDDKKVTVAEKSKESKEKIIQDNNASPGKDKHSKVKDDGEVAGPKDSVKSNKPGGKKDNSEVSKNGTVDDKDIPEKVRYTYFSPFWNKQIEIRTVFSVVVI